ncbi:MAG TPA: endonuclease/exonuclease/phosphatase family protein [Candidatus Hydrogenedentes bacterium]|nr:endonuclease/exonuclease/phosphatase family protein [Candidatus Hydrogenedentota bacterium]HOS01558.1 endonuclease/exonuclease/phosphatase family protein [Candidatus Hydrogenedentota bacterium]
MAHATPPLPRSSWRFRFFRRVLRAMASLLIVCGLVAAILVFLNARTPSQTDLAKCLSGKPVFPPQQRVELTLVSLDLQGRFHIPGPAARAYLEEVAQVVVAQHPDVAAFQEVLNQQDRDTLISVLDKAGLVYHAHFPAGLRGSGLLIASRHPFSERCYHRFVASGDWFRPWRGDWYMGKGVAFVRLQLPEDAGNIDLFNVTLHARYRDAPYADVRRRQMAEAMEFIARAGGRAPVLLAVSPLNGSGFGPECNLLTAPGCVSGWCAVKGYGPGVDSISSEDLTPKLPPARRDHTGVWVRPRGAVCRIHIGAVPGNASPPSAPAESPAPSAITQADGS